MAAPLAACLSDARRDALAAAMDVGGDPLRLELPPDGLTQDDLDPRAAAVLGSLYLLSELDQLGVVACAELLVRERWNLGVRDRAAVAALEDYAAGMRDRPDPRLRANLFARLFGAPRPAVVDDDAVGLRRSADAMPSAEAGVNEVFEELLAGYCEALAASYERGGARAAAAVRLTGDRLRANLAPRQYGNTMIVATTLVDQVRASLDLLALPGIGQVFGTTGTWNLLLALHSPEVPDVGRRLDRGRSGRTVVSTVRGSRRGGTPASGTPTSGPDDVVAEAAAVWLAATGFRSATDAA